MSQGQIIPRPLIIYGLSLPLAVLIGYLLSSPYSTRSFFGVGGILLVLSSPILIRWHHPLLILSWNASLNLFILPGQLYIGVLMAVLSFGISLISRALNKQMRFVYVPQLVFPLVYLIVLVVVTAKINGLGIKSLGDQTYGGKSYFFLAVAIIGYFALTSIPIPDHRAQRYTSMFFLSGVTAVVGNLAYMAGPVFYYICLFFPNSVSLLGETEIRYGGFGMAAMAVYFYLLQRFGFRGIFELSKPWRFGVFILVGMGCVMGSFRSHLILLLIITFFQFYYEGLFKTRFFPAAILTLTFCFVLIFASAEYLPLAAQRTLSFLPVKINPVAKLDAEASTQWRIEMWQALLPDVKKHWLIGKGYTINPTDLFLAEESMSRGFARNYESSMISGDYHNGILSLIIPFGIFGVFGFLWFIIAALKVLYSNYQYSPPHLKRINTFLLSFFAGRLFFYLVFFGAFNNDMWYFFGIVGFSIALNHGVRTRPTEVEAEQPVTDLAPQPV